MTENHFVHHNYFTKKTDKVEVYYWPDGTWVYRDKYTSHEFAWKSDDMGQLFVEAGASDETVDHLVRGMI